MAHKEEKTKNKLNVLYHLFILANIQMVWKLEFEEMNYDKKNKIKLRGLSKTVYVMVENMRFEMLEDKWMFEMK